MSQLCGDFSDIIGETPIIPEHDPLGGINRARRAVYELSAELRRRRNGVTTDKSK